MHFLILKILFFKIMVFVNNTDELAHDILIIIPHKRLHVGIITNKRNKNDAHETNTLHLFLYLTVPLSFTPQKKGWPTECMDSSIYVNIVARQSFPICKTGYWCFSGDFPGTKEEITTGGIAERKKYYTTIIANAGYSLVLK